MKKTLLTILCLFTFGISTALLAQVSISLPSDSETTKTGGNQRDIALFQVDSKRPVEVNAVEPITQNALNGRRSQTAKITIFDGSTIVPIKANRISTNVVNNRVHITINTEGLPAPKNAKKFKVRITDADNLSSDFPLK